VTKLFSVAMVPSSFSVGILPNEGVGAKVPNGAYSNLTFL